MLRPLTNIESGWAQAFDSSGMADAFRQNRRRKEKALEANIEQFDPSTIWWRDQEKFIEQVNGYNKFISDNYDALLNKSQNLDTWRKMKSLENQIKSFAAGSKQMEQEVRRRQNLMLDNPEEYGTEENRDFISGVITGEAYEGGLQNAYDNGEAFNTMRLKEFNKNIRFDPRFMTKTIEEKIATPGQPESTVMGDYERIRTPLEYDDEELNKLIAGWWENGDIYNSSHAIKDRFGTIGEYKRYLMDRIQKEKYEDRRYYGEDEGGDREFTPSQITISDPKEMYFGATEYGIRYKEKTKESRFLGMGIKTVETEKADDAVMNLYVPQGVEIQGTMANIDITGTISGYDMSTGKVSRDLLGDTENLQITGAGRAYTAQKDLYFKNITFKNKEGEDFTVNGKVVEKGSILSEEMINAIMTNDGESVLTLDEDGNRVESVNQGNIYDIAPLKKYVFGRGASKV